MLGRLFGIQIWNPEVYLFDKIPNTMSWRDVAGDRPDRDRQLGAGRPAPGNPGRTDASGRVVAMGIDERHIASCQVGRTLPGAREASRSRRGTSAAVEPRPARAGDVREA